MVRAVRFQIQRGDQGKEVVDTQMPEHRWSVASRGSASNSVEGYSVVTRLLRSDSGHPVIAVAGVDPRDTQAAVEFPADGHQFEKFSRNALPDWERRNFQIVLHERIFGKSPGSLNVVASHIW